MSLVEVKTSAESLGLIFNGIEERPNGDSIPRLIDPKTGITFYVYGNENVEEALNRFSYYRKKFLV
jgi:hypothetical protein